MGCVIGLILGLSLVSRSFWRDRRRQHLVVRTRYFPWIWIVVWVTAALIHDIRIHEGAEPRYHPAYLLVVLVLCPDLIVRLVFRPLGWTRAAYALSLLANVTWNLAPRAGAARRTAASVGEDIGAGDVRS